MKNVGLIAIGACMVVYAAFTTYRFARNVVVEPTSLDLIEEEVFLPNNFKIVAETKPIVTLDFIEEPSCEKVFNDWLAIARLGNQFETPPRTIPRILEKEFLLNGHTKLIQAYANNRAKPEARVWSQIPSWLNMSEEDLYKITNYGRGGKAVYHAFKRYPLDGKTGFVIGSETPWVEVFALLNGAKEVITVEYQSTKILGTDKVRYVHPIEFAEKWRSHQQGFDFAASFSSIEHCGLGRYGDAMDPIGDLREVWKTSCLLKKGGIFFLGIPRGKDTIVFNLHRIYGPLRLAMIMAGMFFFIRPNL